MKEDKRNVNPEIEELLSDNLADALPNEPDCDDSAEETAESPDNVAEQLAKMKDDYLRLMAEYDNFRKRTLKEKADLIKNGGEKVLVGLLPVIDDFERALSTIGAATDLNAIKEGIELIYNKFTAFLRQNGVQPIETVGTAFDADLHEAVAVVPPQNDAQKDTIIDNVQTGYTLNDKVIRHAKVVVAAGGKN